MLSKLLLVVVGAIAYVLGAKAGRERYEQIMDQLTRLWRNPQVREKAAEAADVVKERAPEAKDRIADGAKRAADKVAPDHGDKTIPDHDMDEKVAADTAETEL